MCWGVEFHKFFPTFFIPEYKKMYFFKIIFFYFSTFYSSERFVSTHTFNMVNATKCLWVVPYRSGEIKKHIFWNHLKWDIEKTRICSFLMVYYATTRPKLVGRPRVPSIPHSPLTPARWDPVPATLATPSTLRSVASHEIFNTFHRVGVVESRFGLGLNSGW